MTLFPATPAIAAAAVLLFGLLCAQTSGATQGTLDKIRTSGRAVLGVREASPPMAYALGANEKYVGYHVELCERVLREIAPDAKLEYLAATAQSTLALVQNGTLDIGCGPTTNNTARQQQVAFAVTTYVSEVRMAVRADSAIRSISQLGGRTVAASTGTTAVQMLRRQERALGTPMNILLGKDHAESFLLLESGRADAFVLDDNLLAGVIAGAKNPGDFRIVGEPLGAEPIALLFRKDDPAFKAAVDGVLTRLMQTGELEKIYAKWFTTPIPPKNLRLNLPMGAALKALIASPNDKPLETYLK
ncbi:amino acid ABC transporter substrate-binding protein [Verminephrobacter aporrectodeae subsp. tuberculatae]|uniref:amino acid ABC transporter substrate-binding protein n=1 Tax=Verminephrobacter aporrectodeae TaxID=1110389 RepID=UPI00023761AA|nr:amino acid ABC transporter substrate-binding protein [Verminephrobacter aporrectodeae]MCW8167196.1 amino acid ABC transporter substrate-binding protein [Verminephrobacter aporrectodeae subsp. tuberculatae]MCW8169035.1 amino acid ABC transporter substrate-binding protein [Verminephrobacter aporrectodeae subsp. tuberculatae]